MSDAAVIDDEPYSPLWVPEEDAPVEYRKRVVP